MRRAVRLPHRLVASGASRDLRPLLTLDVYEEADAAAS